MSWKAWSEVGYGYPLWNDHNTKTICRYIADYAADRLLAEDAVTLKRFADGEIELEMYEIEEICDESVSWLIAGLMNEDAGTTIFRGYCACGDTDQEEYIGAEPCYPWTMNEVDKSLTSGDIIEILSEWSEKLGIDEAPDYFEAFYCG